jgi:DNA sulfur modification protein DndB
MDIQENIVSERSLINVKYNRMKIHVLESIHPELRQKYEEAGWELDKILSKKVRMRKAKTTDVLFEDEVWLTFANLGFKYLNKDRNFKIPYTTDGKLTQQIDVFAADDETIIFIECKATDAKLKKGNFKETIEAIGGKKDGIIKEIKKLFPGKKHKVKFIFATKNYIVSDPDKDRLTQFGILHFDEEIIQYYTDLSKHLGHSARFQLLGNLFEGQKIPEIENIIPAIEGSMGGHTYYSFSIEPEKLLKIGYVLHRNKANKKFMPTYQRLIKKSRLVAIQSFVNGGGFFPNSIIINIDTRGNGLRFDLSSLQVDYLLSRIGLLHLPQKYRSAFIIDGQHRLYGYAESEYMSTNSIPVVAFVDLKREEQVKLFMEINENQKAVSKNLRNTLNSDLLWSSANFNEQRKALKLQIAQELGEEKSSPLYDRVIVGENQKTPTCCITIDTIHISLNTSNFFSQFKANAITKDGTFDKGNNDATYDAFFPFIQQCFDYVQAGLPDEWAKGESDRGCLAINAGIYSLIRLFNDIVDHLIAKSAINPKTEKAADIIEEMAYYLDPVIKFLDTLSVEQKESLRKSYGTGGRTKYWRTLQRAIAEIRPEFNPEGMEQYWEDNAKTFNEESYKMIRDIEVYLRNDFKDKLLKKYGTDWFTLGLPKPVYDAANKLASDKNYESISTGERVEPWDCLTMINYREIAVYGSNWSELFEKEFTKPGEERLSGGKKAKTEWFFKLSRIRNENFHTYSVSEQEYEFLKELHNWLIT